MIKNESKIIERSLKSVEGLVDAFCVCDTGSTDNTVEIVNKFLETHVGCLTVEPWKNFGYNRTISFQRARNYVRDTLKWNLSETYGLLLDADMVFIQGALKSYPLTELGYSIVQKNHHLTYYNCRLVRFDFDWKCKGVTHEYWDGPAHNNIPESICFIDDRNDGGCKSDKIPRDIKLLEDGLKEDPENVRYMFYLAQSYKDCGRIAESIKMYKKRIKAGGWDEEVWYSHFMIGQCYLMLQDVFKFEAWMQKAYTLRPSRGEPMYALAEFFRKVGHHFKAYQYTLIGQKISYPKDVLFVENFCHSGGFDYEASILEYYVNPDRKSGLRSSIRYLLKNNQHFDNVISNLKFYINQIPNESTKLDIPNVFGGDFRPSAISISDYPFVNVRFVNYLVPVDSQYRTRDGSPIQTKNAYINLETMECIAEMADPQPLFPSNVKGIEDLRIYKHNNKLNFTATSYHEFVKDKIAIVHGEYNLDTKTLANCVGINSPFNRECEKNWINIAGTDEFIYSWKPLRIGKIVGNRFIYNKEIETPPFFEHLRGSANPMKFNNKWICLVHFVEYCMPRKYYHCFVEMNDIFKPTRISLPFYFKHSGIEYCISTQMNDNKIECFISVTDGDPHKVVFKYSDLEWIGVP